MSGILTPILGGLRRLVTTTAGRRHPVAAPAAPPRRLARRLADAIDRAMALGLWEHADRLARTAASLAPGYARLAEPLARLRLAQGDPETAIRVIDCGCFEPPATSFWVRGPRRTLICTDGRRERRPRSMPA
jgi:hypothetical protein